MMANVKITPHVTIYKSGGGARIALSIAFFFLLLFSVNALAGAIWLASNYYLATAALFFLMFLAGGALMFYAGLFLFAVSHTEAQLRAGKATFVLPNWRGPTPVFPYTQCEVPYADIAAVETRGEVYRYFTLPVVVQAASVVRKDGRRITLGYVCEDAKSPAMPFVAIATQIAGRARVPLNRRGMVDGGTGWRALLQDEPGWDAPEMAPEQAEALRAQARQGGRLVAGALGALLAAATVFLVVQLYI